MIVAPTEPEELRAIASTVSLLPERFGADVFFYGVESRRVGIQRKFYTDLLASVTDGRLAKEVMQMAVALDYPFIIIEGQMQWTTDGKLVMPFSRGNMSTWSQKQWVGLILSIMDKGVSVLFTDSLSDTIGLVQTMEQWFVKSSHSSLTTRPNGVKELWGQRIGQRDFANWMMQGIPGVGFKLADRIFDMYGMRLRLELTKEELMKVEGIGKGKADEIERLFNGTE